MPKPPVPDDVRRFILTSIPSVPFLEAVLLLRAERATAWDAASVARRLYVPALQAQALLEALEAAGIAGRDAGGRFAWQPATAELAALLDAVALAYTHDLMQVTQMIHARVPKRAQQFADAFRWKKNEGGPG